MVRVNPDRWKEAPFGAPEYRNMSTSEAAAQFPEEFDAIIASEVLEHVFDWKQLVSDASNCLKVIPFSTSSNLPIHFLKSCQVFKNQATFLYEIVFFVNHRYI